MTTDPSAVLTREFHFSTGSIHMHYDPDATTPDSVLIDSSGPIRLSLDEVHTLYSCFADFLAAARVLPQAPLHQDAPK